MLKRIVSYLTVIALVITSLTFTPSKKVEAAGWSLVWSDEFNENALDTGVWNYDIGGSDGGGWGNNELQYYTNRSDNVYVNDGTLKIVAKREDYGGCRYTSGRLTTKNKKTFQYGKMEARIKVNSGNQKGVWPAFWMMGNERDWPYCGELDIMEHANDRNYVEGTIHWNEGEWGGFNHIYWGSYSNGNYYYFSDNVNNGINGWHTYGVIWDADKIQWYVDDNIYLTAYLQDNNAYAFRNQQYFLLNLALGSNSTGYTGNTAPDESFSSATMEVDYVRAYQWSESGGEEPTQPGGNTPSGYTDCNGDGAWHNVGQWNYSVGGNWAGAAAAYTGGNELNNFSMYIKSKATQQWGNQIKSNEIGVTSGHTYNYSITVNSNKSASNVMLKELLTGGEYGTELMTKTLSNGDTVFSGTYTPTTDRVQFLFDLWDVPADTTVKITNITLTDTTQATVQTTTQAPTQPSSNLPSGYAQATTGDGNWVNVGQWNYQFNDWNKATGGYKDGSTLNNLSLYIGTSSEYQWGIMAKTQPISVVRGHTYAYTIDVNASKSTNTVMLKNETDDVELVLKELDAGNNSFTGTITPNTDSVQLLLDFGRVASGTTLNITKFTLTDTTSAESTQAPTQPSTTQAPTQAPTQPSTTQAPTQAPTDKPTTEVPTQVPTDKPTTEVPTQAPTQKPTVGETTKAAETKLPKASDVDKAIISAKTDKDPSGSTFGKLCARVKKSTKTSNTIKWKKASGAVKYIIYAAKCATPTKKLKETTKTSYVHKKLKKGKYYKYLIVAVDKDGNMVALSKMIHVATKGGKVGNAKKIILKKKKVTLKVGKKYTIKAKQKADEKNVKIKKHRKISYETSNAKVAIVSGRGKITAKGKGKCTIYVYAQNGTYAKVTVTVK